MEGKSGTSKSKPFKQPTFSSLSKSFKLPPSSTKEGAGKGDKKGQSGQEQQKYVLNQVKKFEEKQKFAKSESQQQKIQRFLGELGKELEERKKRFQFTRRLEEEERARRLTSISHILSLKKVEERKSLFQKPQATKGWTKERTGLKRKENPLDAVKKLEEEERQRRINESKKVGQVEKERSIASRAHARHAEEEERQRRMRQQRGEDWQSKSGSHKRAASVPSRTSEKPKKTVFSPLDLARNAEEEERQRRIDEGKNLDAIEKERRANNKAYTIISEEDERQRRISQEKYIDEVEDERRADNRAYSRIAEEEEKQRRVAQEGYLDEVEDERRADNRAYSRIAEEEEKQRRIAQEGYLDEVEDERRADNRAYSRIAEEEEKQRRIAQDEYVKEFLEKKKEQSSKSILQNIKNEEEKERQRRISIIEKTKKQEMKSHHRPVASEERQKY